MQPILASYEAPFWCNLQKNTGLVEGALTGLIGASYDTKIIGFIKFLWAEAKKYKFSFLLCAVPLRAHLHWRWRFGKIMIIIT